MNKIAVSLLSMSSIALVVNVINYSKQIIIAEKFGATKLTDAYFTSYIVVILSLQLFSNSFSTVIVPVFAEIKETKGIKSSWKFISNLLNFTIICSFLLSFLSFTFSDKIITKIAPGFDSAQQQIAIKLLQMMAFMIVLNALNGLLSGILHSFKKFVLKEFTILLTTLINLVFIILFNKSLGIYCLAYGLIISTSIQFCVLFFLCIKNGFTYNFTIDLKEAGIRKFLKSSLYITFGTIIGFLAPVLDRILASKLSPGSLSSLDYGEKIVNIYTAAIVVPLSTILLTSFSELVSSNKRHELIKLLQRSICIISFVIFPMAAMLVSLAHPIVTLIFQRGAFDEIAVQKTAISVQYYAAWLLVFGICGITSRIFYANQMALKPILVGIVGVLFSIILKISLVGFLSQGGLALANSISTSIKAIILVWLVKKLYHEFQIYKLLKIHVRILCVSIITGLITIFVFNSLFASNYYSSVLITKLIYIFLTLSCGMATYFFLSLIIQTQESFELIQIAFSVCKVPLKWQHNVICALNLVLKKLSINTSRNS